MERQILDISEGNRYLSKVRGLLSIRCDGNTESERIINIPFDEIEAIIVHTPQATYSSGCLQELAIRNIPLVLSNNAHSPVGWLWPATGNFEQSRRMFAQTQLSKAFRDRLWKKIVIAKIRAQAEVLKLANIRHGGLIALSKTVKPGDPENIEAQAAQRYWPALLGAEFRRRRNGDDPNGLLNYGYTILRASITRYICASGLHPSIGLHHSNRFNAFCLADDLMEPFRPAVDMEVWRLGKSNIRNVSPQTKAQIAAVLSKEMDTDRGAVPLSRCVEWATQSLAQSILDKTDHLKLPRSTSFK